MKERNHVVHKHKVTCASVNGREEAFLRARTSSKHVNSRTSLSKIARAAESFARAARSSATKRAYASDWKDFSTWCAATQLRSLPAESSTVALYITALAEKGRKVATIRRRLVAISSIHKSKGLQSPCGRSQRVLHEVMQGICRALGTHQQGKRPILLGMLRKVLGNLDANLRGARDRALLLCGFAGGLRRSELSSIRAENLRRHSRGITIFLPSSKTDQEGKGREVEIVRGTQTRGTPSAKLTCPVRSLELWLKAGQITAGPVFRHITAAQTIREGLSGHSIGWIIKRTFRRAGFTTAELQHYSAHSLRAGFASVAYRNGARELDIARQTGHTTLGMVRKYIREEQKQRLAAARKLGL
jgi:integrase